MLKRLIQFKISMLVYGLMELKDRLYLLLGRKLKARPIILYYHAVTEEELPRFSRQMDLLLRLAKPFSLENGNGQFKPGDRYAAVTFDDGLADTAKRILPELVRRNIPVTLFVPSGCLGKRPAWIPAPQNPDDGERVMTADELREARKTGWVTIGSHCVTHRSLLTLGEEDAQKEILQSKETLENILGEPINFLSFPHGDYREHHLKLTLEAGYSRVFGILPTYAFRGKDRVAIGRIKVDPGDWPLEFKLKLLGGYGWLPWAFHLKRKLAKSWRSGRARVFAGPPGSLPVD